MTLRLVHDGEPTVLDDLGRMARAAFEAAPGGSGPWDKQSVSSKALWREVAAAVLAEHAELSPPMRDAVRQFLPDDDRARHWEIGHCAVSDYLLSLR